MIFGDSSAVFEQRSKAIGLEAGVVQCFKDANLDTTAKSAFACNFSPGGSDDAPLKELLTKVLGRAATLVGESCLRRLFNESNATVAADIRVQTEQTNEDSLLKLAPADRAARLEEQQKRLTGMDIKGPYGPGDTVVDKFVSFYESDRLQWISWDQCISREHELTSNNKKDQRLVVQSSGELKISSASRFEPRDTSSEILCGIVSSERHWPRNRRTSWHTITMIDGLKKSCLAGWKRYHQVPPEPPFSRSRPGYEKGQHDRPPKGRGKGKRKKSTEPVHAHSFGVVEFGLQRSHTSGQ